MSEVIEAKGRCLCGAVQFTAKQMKPNVGACHCKSCRRWCGGPYMPVDCGVEVSFEGNGNISVFASSEWAERGFCKQCGSHLFYRVKATQQHLMAVGLFDDDHPFLFDHQVFIDEKPLYYSFGNKTHDMTGDELIAAMSAG